MRRTLSGSVPLVLDDPHRAWQISGGGAQVFAVGCRASSRRFPLFSLAPGDWALPVPSGALVLVVVGIDPAATAEAVPLPCDLGPPGAGCEPAEVLARPGALEAVETWIERLTLAVGEPGPADGIAIRPGDPTRLDAGDLAWCGQGTVWIEIADGPRSVAFFGDEPADGSRLCDAAPGCVPLPPAAWVRARRPTVVATEDGHAALSTAEGWRGLDRYERAVLRRLGARLEAQADDLPDRLERRGAQERRQRERAAGRLSRVLEPDRRRVAEPATDDPVDRSLAVVARYLAVSLRLPRGRPSGDVLDRVEAVARSSGLRSRRVTLGGRWWRESAGALVGTRLDGTPVALLPGRSGTVEMVDPAGASRRAVDSARRGLAGGPGRHAVPATAARAAVAARALPVGAPGAGPDVRRIVTVGVALGLLSLFPPLVTEYIFGTVVPERQAGELVGLTGLLLAFAVSTYAFSVAQRQALARVTGQMGAEAQAALWDRVLRLPLGFFRRHSVGSIASKVMAVDQIEELAAESASACIAVLPVAVFNLALAFVLQARLAAFALAVVVVGTLALAWFSRAQTRHLAAMTAAGEETFGLATQLIEGIAKLRVANAERRAFCLWADRFAGVKEAFVTAQRGFAVVTAVGASVTTLTILAILLAVATLPVGSVSQATFIAFNTAFGQVLAATVAVTGVAVFAAQARPLAESVLPVVGTPAEISAEGADPGALSGAIEVSHVGLRYVEDAPKALDDVSLELAPGEFVGVVGPSGSGKSTLLRLMLGLDRPGVGTVRYDGNDLATLDLQAVRRQIGVVTQSVRLLPGDVLTNIVGNHRLTEDDAWAAAEIAGIAEDIRAMPMQMHTFVTEGSSTFSGGQRQRLLIARAVVAKPRILLFDEATSALDNRSQSRVTAALARLRASRVVIAHRLSTIRGADRILVLQGGRLVESGTYGALMAARGVFARLAERQLQ